MKGVGSFVLNIVTIVSIGFVLFLRNQDISETSADSPINLLMLAVLGVTLVTFFMSPAQNLSTSVRRLGLVAIIAIQLKIQWDSVDKRVNISSQEGRVALIVGGNGGLGQGIAAQLLSKDCKVILACRHRASCASAFTALLSKSPDKAHLLAQAPDSLDLADLQSVKYFATSFSSAHQRLDFLIFTAGSLTPSGTKSAQELEYSFASMALGPFALSQWLLPTLVRPIKPTLAVSMDVDGDATGPLSTSSSTLTQESPARIIAAVSHASFLGSFHPSLLTSALEGDFRGEVNDNCGALPATDAMLQRSWGMLRCAFGMPPTKAATPLNGYARAQLSMVLLMQELQKRLDTFLANQRLAHPDTFAYRRVITATVNPGTVGTALTAFHQYLSPLFRSSHAAGAALLHAVGGDFVPSSYIDSALSGHDLGDFESLSLENHVVAFPELVENKSFDWVQRWLKKGDATAKPTDTSSARAKWRTVTWMAEEEGSAAAPTNHIAIGKRLYEVSLEMVRNFQSGRPLLQGDWQHSVNPDFVSNLHKRAEQA